MSRANNSSSLCVVCKVNLKKGLHFHSSIMFHYEIMLLFGNSSRLCDFFLSFFQNLIMLLKAILKLVTWKLTDLQIHMPRIIKWDRCCFTEDTWQAAALYGACSMRHQIKVYSDIIQKAAGKWQRLGLNGIGIYKGKQKQEESMTID